MVIPAPARPRPISRSNTGASSSSSVPTAQIAGIRRSHANANGSNGPSAGNAAASGVIDLADDSDEEANGVSARDNDVGASRRKANGSNTEATVRHPTTQADVRRSKRSRLNGTGDGGGVGGGSGGDDVIVVDD